MPARNATLQRSAYGGTRTYLVIIVGSWYIMVWNMDSEPCFVEVSGGKSCGTGGYRNGCGLSISRLGLRSCRGCLVSPWCELSAYLSCPSCDTNDLSSPHLDSFLCLQLLEIVLFSLRLCFITIKSLHGVGILHWCFVVLVSISFFPCFLLLFSIIHNTSCN